MKSPTALSSILFLCLFTTLDVMASAQTVVDKRAGNKAGYIKPPVSDKTRGSKSEQSGQSGQVQGNPVLDPEKFFGQAKAGYAAARQIPQICRKLFCYCGCDLTDCHASLLDCFTNEHGEDCHLCQEEAILALKLHKEGKDLSFIQKTIDQRYESEYPFDSPSDILNSYRAKRLWSSATPSEKIPTATGQRRLRKDGTCCIGDKPGK